MDLRGKVAVVTGSSRGIGKRIALTLARSGADIVLSARTAEPGQSKLPGTINETAEEVRALGVKALPVRADLTVRDDVRRLYQTALEHFGRVDVLVNKRRTSAKACSNPSSIRRWIRGTSIWALI
jgi:citronellol/citronellal dehydrogenase